MSEEILNEELDNIIVLNDENGEELEFEFLDSIEYLGKEYLVLLPTDDEDNSVVILEVEPINDEDENYLSVEDETVLNAVYYIFKERNKDYFTFE